MGTGKENEREEGAEGDRNKQNDRKQTMHVTRGTCVQKTCQLYMTLIEI